MMNTGKFASKTILITGASRGIGKAIALKLAKDGANIVIAAKTAAPHPSLPGTIHTAAEEIRSAGGRALACEVDVQDEGAVERCVEKAVAEFGGLDALVNNASAISLTPTLDTAMKRFDLMHRVNTRGTFLMSQKCIPYLKQSSNGHILNISPPLNMDKTWFAPHVAYTMAKYGMSMCVLGMAEELHPSNIAVNALWPKTAIWTAAMEMLAGSGGGKQCRKPDIMADAAYAVLSRDSRNFTGNFCVDEALLRENGVDNFDQYAVEPGHPLLPDFFLGEDHSPDAFARTIKKHGGAPKWDGGADQRADGGDIKAVFERLRPLINEQLCLDTKALFEFVLDGANAGSWFLDLKEAPGGCGEGAAPRKADVTFRMDSADFVDMFGGDLKPTQAFMAGKLKIEGDISKAMKLERLLHGMRSKI